MKNIYDSPSSSDPSHPYQVSLIFPLPPSQHHSPCSEWGALPALQPAGVHPRRLRERDGDPREDGQPDLQGEGGGQQDGKTGVQHPLISVPEPEVVNVLCLQVSWLRHSDTHLLTAGRYTYTSDERFRAIHKVLSEDYILQIDPVQVRNI